ncbi:hypothetical protein OEZ85_000199 [Tetradesmus obliquus]|uniref:Expansin-like EG45 domain-containing protein n=1 Tax=Tetradesmus obliquus TaxID=3088 RepID=A0ABY8USZ3_TETOB|nr:hypothetical protein OEZ85_000199 [Tetradesmus obliquus]
MWHCEAPRQIAAQGGYTFGQATWYDSILQGFCGYFDNIPSNGFVGAWPYVETGAPGTGRGFWQEGAGGDACGRCFEVSCVPRFVESADGSVFLDRRSACRDTSRGAIIQIVDECRCSNSDRQLSERGNFNWCCNVKTPRLGVDRHIDLSKQVFTELIRDGDFGLGIMGLRWRSASCSYIGPVRINADGSTTPIPGAAGAGASSGSGRAPRPPQPSQPPRRPAAPAVAPKAPAPASKPAPPPASKPAPTPAAAPRPPTPPPASRPPTTPPPAARPPPASKPPSNPPPAQPTPAPKPSSSSSGSKSGGKKPLPVESQCGGTSGSCSSFGGSSACKDQPFSGYECEAGLNCVRQSVYYWQCWDKDHKATLDSNWSKTKPKGTRQCPTYRPLNQQCGGIGGDCKGEDCVDQALDGCCEPGLSCVRFDQYYWECRKK